jgi:hypothetical protein
MSVASTDSMSSLSRYLSMREVFSLLIEDPDRQSVINAQCSIFNG